MAERCSSLEKDKPVLEFCLKIVAKFAMFAIKIAPILWLFGQVKLHFDGTIKKTTRAFEKIGAKIAKATRGGNFTKALAIGAQKC